MDFKKLLIFVMLLLLLPVVSAQGQQRSSINDPGLEVSSPLLEYVKEYTPLTFNFHVYNATGFLVNNATVQCEFHLYNSSNAHIIDTTNISFSGNDFEYIVNSSTLTRGEWSFLVTCNDSNVAGFSSSSFLVTKNGFELQDNEFGWVILVVMSVAALFAWLSTKIDSKALSFLFLFTSLILGVVALNVAVAEVSYFVVEDSASLAYLVVMSITVFTFMYSIIMFIYESLTSKNMEVRQEEQG